MRQETHDTTVKKIDSTHSPRSEMGAKYLRILETFTAVEATSPPYQVHGREEKGSSGKGNR